MKRAAKMGKYQKSMSKINERKNTILLMTYFDLIKNEVKMTKKSQMLKIYYHRSLFKQFVSTQSYGLKKQNVKKQNIQTLCKFIKVAKYTIFLRKFHDLIDGKNMLMRADKHYDHFLLKKYLKELKYNN